MAEEKAKVLAEEKAEEIVECKVNDIVKNFKKVGCTIEQIVAATGLSRTVIENL